jgi:hypothetical protein
MSAARDILSPEGWDPGPVPQLAWLPIDRLLVDPAYQRTIEIKRSQRLIWRIAENFSWAAFGVLSAVVGDKPQSWVLIDGQHRRAAALLREIALVPAVVNPPLDQAQQATMFIQANRDRAAIDHFTLHHAAVAARDARAVAIEALAAGAGIKIPHSHPGARTRAPGVAGVVDVFGRLLTLYPNYAAEACGAVADAYRAEPGGLRAPLLIAAAVLLGSGVCDRSRLTAILAQSTAAALDREIAQRGGSNSRSRGRVANAVLILRERLAAHAAADPRWPSGVRFQDSARAVADHGSTRAERELGHSPMGSALGGLS